MANCTGSHEHSHTIHLCKSCALGVPDTNPMATCFRCQAVAPCIETVEIVPSQIEGFDVLGGLCMDCYHATTLSLIKRVEQLNEVINKRNSRLAALTRPTREYVFSEECLCGFHASSFFEMQKHLLDNDSSHISKRDFVPRKTERTHTPAAPRAFDPSLVED